MYMYSSFQTYFFLSYSATRKNVLQTSHTIAARCGLISRGTSAPDRTLPDANFLRILPSSLSTRNCSCSLFEQLLMSCMKTCTYNTGLINTIKVWNLTDSEAPAALPADLAYLRVWPCLSFGLTLKANQALQETAFAAFAHELRSTNFFVCVCKSPSLTRPTLLIAIALHHQQVDCASAVVTNTRLQAFAQAYRLQIQSQCKTYFVRGSCDV